MRRIYDLAATALCAVALAASVTGCELISSVDRSAIKGEGDSDACSNQQKDDTETDIDCGGSCAHKCDAGQKCRATTDCASTFCVDGVCCNEACDADCKACSSETKKDASASGTCGQAKAAYACGKPKSCTDGTETVGDTCDEAGACTDNSTMVCDPGYTCDAAGTACGTSCKEATDCAPCYECSNSACTPVAVNGTSAGCEVTTACDGAGSCKAAIGQACAAAGDCASGSCADGVCCDTACEGACQACNLPDLVGTCSNVASNEDDAPLCLGATTACDGSGACKLVGGQQCKAGTECVSGVCSFGVCGL